MSSTGAESVTVWLARWNDGRQDALDHLLPLLYDELRHVARRQVRGESAGALSATTVVHETYLRLLQQRQIGAADRDGFLGVAACAMRRVLVDHARRRKRLKRGAGAVADVLDAETTPAILDALEIDQVLALDQVLARLEAMDARAAAVVTHRIFGGLTLDETAAVLRTSAKTVQRDWLTARAWLRKELAAGGVA